MNAWFDHCALVFNQYNHFEASRQYFMNHWYNDLGGAPGNLRGSGRRGNPEYGSCVSPPHLPSRQVFTMGGIGEVSTKEPYRRRGLSGRLLEMAIDYMEAEGMDFSMLFTGSPRHYSRFGWEEATVY